MLVILLKTIGVLLLAGAGAALGLRAARWGRPWWLVVYTLPLVLILAIVLARRLPRLEFVAPTACIEPLPVEVLSGLLVLFRQMCESGVGGLMVFSGFASVFLVK